MTTSTPPRRWTGAAMPLGVVVLLAMLAGLALRTTGCQEDDQPSATARQVASRADLIGGPGALGEVGDYLLENGQIRVVIQGPGFSRGFGVYGGSLIDADLQRPSLPGDQLGGTGRDQFGELFPIFFLEAQVPEKVEVLSDGSDGGAARVKVTGVGGEFLTLTKSLNQLILNSREVDPTNLANPDALNGAPQIEYSTVYELAPDVRYVKIETTMTNIVEDPDAPPLDIPPPTANALLGAVLDGAGELDIPLGHVILFGAGNSIFSPGAGYDIRFTLEESYEASLTFPALPGMLTDTLVTSSSNGISYGFIASGDTPGFVENRLDPETGEKAYEQAYEGVKVASDTMLVPFVASAFTGVFYAQAPNQLARGESFTFTSYFIVGNGDVGSVMDAIYALKDTPTERLLGVVRDQVTLEPVEDASVIIYDEAGRPFNQFFTDANGRFLGTMPVGRYSVRIEDEPVLSEPVLFELGAGGALLNLERPSPATVTVQVRDEFGRPLPSRLTVVGTVDPNEAAPDREEREYLFDLAAGQHWRPSDFIPDDPTRPETLQYIEARDYTDPNGTLTLAVRPGKVYTAFISRGLEYDVQRIDFRAEAGRNFPITTSLRRVVDTSGYVGADFHLHAAPSLDSSLSLADRVTSCVGEGLEVLVSTDHNFVTDYRPTLEQLELTQWASSIIGLELTTLEAGHFNGFPVKRDVGKITRGSFEWSLRPPDEIFAQLRSMGKYGEENTVIQVNHARDSILGYFSQHDVSALDPQLPQISVGGFDFGNIVTTNGPAFRRYALDSGESCDPEAEGAPNDCVLRSTFSFDFNAMEIFNGKRLDQIHHLRMPPTVAGLGLSEELVAALPAAGTVLCDGDGGVAFPGLTDDWFNLLNQGRIITGLGNSDSHDQSEEEPGFPRSYVFVGDDDPAFVDELAIIRGVQNQQVIVTNGPFVELFVNGEPVGARVRDNDGVIDVRVKVQAAPWVDVRRGVLFLNGERVETFEVDMSGGPFEFTTQLAVTGDSWVVVEVEGFRSLFPVVAPLELGPIDLTDAVGSLAGPLGFGSGGLGELEPAETRIVTPYAITNPIFILTQGDTFQAPGLPNRVCGDGAYGVTVADGDQKAAPRAKPSMRKKMKRAGLVPSLWFPRDLAAPHDIRTLFDSLGHHNHGH